MQFKALTVLALSALAIASPENPVSIFVTPPSSTEASVLSVLETALPPELKRRQSASVTENPTEASVLSVLETALPTSLLAIGITNPAELGSIIESSFSAGQTPAWYSALPPDVKSYLPILLSEVASTATVSTPLSNTASISSVQASISAIISSSFNTTTISSVHSASLKATTTTAGSAAGSVTATASSAHASSTGGASYPSAVVGAGVAGALGLLGMLAL